MAASGGLLSDAVTRAALSAATVRCLPDSGCLVFVAQVDCLSPLFGVAQAFNARLDDELLTRGLQWVPVANLDRGRFPLPPSPLLWSLKKDRAISDLLSQPPPLPHTVDRTAAVDSLEQTLAYAASMLSAPEQRLLPQNFEVILTPIIVPVTGPFVYHPKGSSRFNALVATLPAPTASRIVAVREVDVAARKAQYESFTGFDKIIYPIYHGTPLPQNATGIALKGFDLSIRTHGRACGDGVYATTLVNTATGYTLRGSGCIIRMYGKHSPGQYAQNSVFVFPQPEQVLPDAVFDFSDDRTSPEALAAIAASELALKLQGETDAISAAVGASCAAYKAEHLRTWTAAYTSFKQRVTVLLASARAAGSNPPASLAVSAAALASEGRQLHMQLPILLHRPEICAAMAECPVVFVESDTGSGKSLLLCQWACDQACADEDRRVCVLQPKRANADSIARFVARMRGGQLGAEIGLHMGGGVHVASDATRIEFMTHGYFVAAAADPAFFSRFHTVIVDEAHERSVDVELSLAIVRQQLALPEPPFRLILATATIPDSKLFLASVAPPGTRSMAMKVAGRSFPVYTLRRPLPGGQSLAAVVSSHELAQVQARHAFEVAAAIISRAESGDVLVFLPRSCDIMTALDSASKIVTVVEQPGRPAVGERPPGLLGDVVTETATKRVEFLSFTAALTATARQYAQEPIEGLQRVIFCTNVAETGLTFPNVRFVVDSGLENVPTYDIASGSTLLGVRPCAVTSLGQRKGRAGRCAAGIYVPLFSEADEAAAPAEAPSPFDQADISAVALRLLSDPTLKLRLPIPPVRWAACISRLRHLELVAEGAEELTDLGRAVAAFGSSMRAALLLVRCQQLCVPAESAAALAAAVVNVRASRGIIKAVIKGTNNPRISPEVREFARDCLSAGSDHITVAHFLVRYRSLSSRLSSHSQSRRCLSPAVLAEQLSLDLEAAADLIDVFSDIERRLSDWEPAESTPSTLLALMKAAVIQSHPDLVATPNVVGSPSLGLKPALLKHSAAALRTLYSSFLESAGSSPLAVSTSADAVSVTKHSVLHLDDCPVCPMAVYSSLASSDADPSLSVSLVTVFNKPEASAPATKADSSAPKLPRAVLASSLAPLSIPAEVFHALICDSHALEKRLGHKYGCYLVAASTDNGFQVAAHSIRGAKTKVNLTHVRYALTRDLAELASKPHSFPLPVSRTADDDDRLRSKVHRAVVGLTQVATAAGDKFSATVSIDGNELIVLTSGAANAISPQIIGCVNRLLYTTFEVARLPPPARYVRPTASEQASTELPNLAALLSPLCPSNLPLDLRAAHILVWKIGLEIYGGFIRDYVVRGEQANDIDTCTTGGMSPEAASTAAIAALKDVGYTLDTPPKKINAIAHHFSAPDGSKLHLDITAPAMLGDYPHVDCSAGNLILSRDGIAKKRPFAGGAQLTVQDCIDHCRFKQFVSFCRTSPSEVRRVKAKYLDRGWCCINHVPAGPLLDLLRKHPDQYQPRDQFTTDFSKPPS
jgi:HrpA-like RNA helicase